MEFDNEFINILLYGRSGTGKTTLWSTFPGPILAVICSGGMRPGELRSINTPEARGKVKNIVLEDSSELPLIVDLLQPRRELHGKFQTVVLDHTSGYQDLVLKEVLGLEEIPAAKTFRMATQQQFGQVVTACKDVFRSMLNLSCNVVFIAQERVFGTEDNLPPEIVQPNIGADLMPSLARWLNPSVDYICETFIKQKEVWQETETAGVKQRERVAVKGEVDYCLRCHGDSPYTTKFRVPKGYKKPNLIVDPSYAKIMAVIRGEYGKPKATTAPKVPSK